MPSQLNVQRFFPKTLGAGMTGTETDQLAVDPRLICTTSNGCITFCSKNAGSSPEVILKVQMKSSLADDIVFDILNGLVLNECVHGEDARHFTKYLWSGWVYVAFQDANPKRLVEDSKVYKHREMDVKRRPFCATTVVPGATSLGSMFQPKMSSAEQRKIYSMVRRLMQTVMEVGHKHGLTHNDLHTSNVLYDRDKSCLVLIDYGRMLFDGSSVDSGRVIELVRRFKRDSWVGGHASYAQMVQHVLRHHKCRMIDLYAVKEPWFIKHLFMFDIMALSLCIISDLKSGITLRSKDLKDLKAFFEMKEHWRVTRADGRTVLYSLEYSMLHPRLWRKEGLESLFQTTMWPGMFWFALLLQYLSEIDAYVKEVLKGDEKWLTVDMFKLERRKIMHSFGPIICIPEPERFCKFLLKNKDLVQKNCLDVLGAGVVSS
jgi:hypothetical protein